MSQRAMGSVGMAALVMAVIATPGVVAGAAPAPGVTELVSLSSQGVQGNQGSQASAISADGRFVAFLSLADNLVAEDTNLSNDIFVRDRLTGQTDRVSVSSKGREAEASEGLFGGVGGPSISDDGRFVAFHSEASNLVNGDRNNTADVFVHDRRTGHTELVSVATDGTQADDLSTDAQISGDGRFVSFVSFAENLVPDTNPEVDFGRDLFVHDRVTGVTERISQAADGAEADGESFEGFISDDGRFVYFSSFAGNLVAGDVDTNDGVDAYLFDRQAGTMEAITAGRGADGPVLVNAQPGGISGAGRFLTYTAFQLGFVTPDNNGFAEDAWLVDRATGEHLLVGVNDTGEQGDDGTFAHGVSDDGQTVALVSRATNFGGPQVRESVYVRDRLAGVTRLVSVATDGTDGDFPSIEPSLTPDGLQVAFTSSSTTFVPENQPFFASDIFVRDMRPEADLSVTILDEPDPVQTRETLTYTVTVLNDGPSAATDVLLVDTLPDAKLMTITTTQGGCDLEATPGSVTCQLGSLPAGGSAELIITVRAPKPGTIDSTATVDANEPDTNAANNAATETTTVRPR